MKKVQVKLFAGSDPDTVAVSVNKFVEDKLDVSFHHGVAMVPAVFSSTSSRASDPIKKAKQVFTVLVVYSVLIESAKEPEAPKSRTSSHTLNDFSPGQSIYQLSTEEYGKVDHVTVDAVVCTFAEHGEDTFKCNPYDLVHVPVKGGSDV